MALTRDKNVPQNQRMFSELVYVKERLAAHSRSDWMKISKSTGVPFRTITRIAYKETPSPRSDTVGKLAMHFRTKEKRAA